MEPLFRLQVEFDIQQDLVQDDISYWKYYDTDEDGEEYELDDPEYIGPEPPNNIDETGLSMLGVANTLASIHPRHRPLISWVSLETEYQ